MASMLTRLQELSKHYSQAEMARRVGCSRATVSRYFSGRAINIDFCVALVQEFGVNPLWLLVGQGTPFLADADSDNNKLGKNLLDLVQAMEAVAKQSLGALAGKDNRLILRQLDAALKSHDALSESLHSSSKPVFQGLLTELRGALLANKWARAQHLRKSALQVGRFCKEKDLWSRFHRLQGALDARLGHIEEALEHHRQAFASSLLGGPELRKEQATNGHNFVNVLERTGRIAEAHRVCRAVLALLDGPDFKDEQALLLAKKARLDIELGQLEEALQVLSIHPLSQSPEHHERWAAVQNTALLFSGSIDFSMLKASPESFAKSATLFSYALWLEDARLIEETAPAFIEQSVHRRRERKTWVQSLVGALTSPSMDCLQSLRRERSKFSQSPLSEMIEHSVIEAMVSEKVATQRVAKNTWERVETMISQQAEDVQVHLWVRAIYHRVALRLFAPSDQAHQSAQVFFREHLAKGYWVFNDYENVLSSEA